MWLETISAASALLGGTTGMVCYVRQRKMPFAERRSIRNIQQVLHSFIKDGLVMNIEDSARGHLFTYKRHNFRIILHVNEHRTCVRLKDDELSGDQIFFSFEYKNKTKELVNVNETSSYYERYGHFTTNQALFKQFIQKVMSIDWENLEAKEQERLMEKYRVSEKPSNHPTPASVGISSNHEQLKPCIEPYVCKLQTIKSRSEKLAIEEIHAVERDYNYMVMLCKSFEALSPAQQAKELPIVKKRIEEKVQQLDDIIQCLQNEALYEFQKINEVMKTDNRN